MCVAVLTYSILAFIRTAVTHELIAVLSLREDFILDPTLKSVSLLTSSLFIFSVKL